LSKTSDSSQNLQSQTASGVFWTFLEQLGRRGIGILVTILLARFLTPDDYGLIAMVSVFFAFANALMDVGFRQALIRKQNATQIDYATMFYSNPVSDLHFNTFPWITSFYGGFTV
jgi:O-antigen/teichoic acid export membrane protein